MVKTIEQNRETLGTHDGDTLVHRHVVRLDERHAEGITVVHCGEPEVLHGPRKGQRGKPGSFVSKRSGNLELVGSASAVGFSLACCTLPLLLVQRLRLPPDRLPVIVESGAAAGPAHMSVSGPSWPTPWAGLPT